MQNINEVENICLDDISLFEECETSDTVNCKGINDDDDLVPIVGMCFDSADSVKNFYRQYAISKGFGIRTRSSKKGPNKELRYFMLVCARAGKYVSPIPTEVNTQPTQRIECPARITVGIKNGKWYIMSVHEEHSHDLSPTKSRLFRGNRRINLHTKRMLDMNDDAGVRINKSYQSFVSAAGGYDNLEFVERDVRNYVGKQRRALGKEGDGKALLTHFSRMRELNEHFFFDIDFDIDNRIRNIFWADARSRATWESFRDVLCFDTTYLTNKYDMPFAPFVGVNHHGQSILLGCGLLSSEDTNAFVWLFQTWLRCMSNRPPKGIVTDQCRAMQNAIEFVFPNASHRWCLWHIMKKIPEKLQGYGQYKQIKHAMKIVVYESTNVDEFLSSWENFITAYDLSNNVWLTTLFEERQRWVPCFLKNFFWAGMSTT
ncbi:protein FAR-RED IMPAIRED RESPONSE 1-like [Phaseolus vulgaris]|uniref:protein FAR-RED IMPAIRED RESPONSE 1-like n=1 Tax=Phaseolus vulgaris TaxID=3885 RepID=UPI0035CADD1C